MRQRDSFQTPLVVEEMGDRFKLFLPFTYYWKRYKININVPKDFITDLASIPHWLINIIASGIILAGHYLNLDWMLWVGVVVIILSGLISKLGRYNKAAVLHDLLYHLHGYGVETPNSFTVMPLSRAKADLLFLDAMTGLKVKKWKRYAMYYFVRIWGWLAWR